MKRFGTEMTTRICFFFYDKREKFKRIIFHYKGTNLVTYRIRQNKVIVIANKNEEHNFQFLKSHAHKDWEKYFEYELEEHILTVTFKNPIFAFDIKTAKKDPEWGEEYDSISFEGHRLCI